MCRQSYRTRDVKTMRDQLELEDITTTPEKAERKQVMKAQSELEEPWARGLGAQKLMSRRRRRTEIHEG